MMTIENFVSGLSKVLRMARVEERESSFVIIKSFDYSDSKEEKEEELGEIDKEELIKYAEECSKGVFFNGSCLHNKKSYEVAVKPQDRNRGLPYRYYEREIYSISEHNYEMSISKASTYYIFALLCYIGQQDNEELDIDFFSINRSIRMKEIHKFNDFAESVHILTAKITTHIDHSQHEFSKMMQSYLFNIAYNKDIVFTVTNFKGDIRRRRSARREGQLFPYKSYNNELITYYYQGVSTDIPFTQYLAFYHVAEFFFQTIAEQDAFQEIENYITHPSFSPYRKEDIRVFYNRIKKKMKEQKEDGLWDEKTGLLLCLKKYVLDLENLKNTINAIDATAIEYYKKEKVPFASEGGIINFSDSQDAVYATIRNRVYSVRNAIVHSKEGEKLRYEPFKHDKELSKEIPLIRAIAEEIIVNSAKRLDFIKFD